MSAPAIVVYSTPTCHPCKAAKRKLDAEGIAYTPVDLTEDEAALAGLKERLNATIIQTPLFAFGNELLTIADLPRIIRESKAALEVSSK